MSAYRYIPLGGSSTDGNSFRKGFLFAFIFMTLFLGLVFCYTNYFGVIEEGPITVLPTVSDTTISSVVDNLETTTLIQNVENLSEKKGRVWDTVDGEGYQFEKEPSPLILDPRFDEFNRLVPCGKVIKNETLDKIKKIQHDFSACIEPIVEEYKGKPNEMFLDWVPKARVCDKLPVFEELGVEGFENLHETKWAILPKCKADHNLLTLGVGHDTTAEEKLNRTLPNVKFYGADPIIEPNRQMYSAFGKFFPFAIGKEPGFTKFRVLPNQNQKTRQYVFQDVTTIPFLFFVKDILKFKRIDFAWIDIEGGEFEFLDQLHDGVTICQFNIEMHMKFRPSDGAQKFYNFIIEILARKKYVFLNTKHTEFGVHRMFFLNLEDRECVAKFFD